MMTCDKSSSYDAWPKHVIGAATFLGYLHSANGLPQSPVAEIVDVCFTTVSHSPSEHFYSLLIILQ